MTTHIDQLDQSNLRRFKKRYQVQILEIKYRKRDAERVNRHVKISGPADVEARKVRGKKEKGKIGDQVQLLLFLTGAR